jgi:hypothetical protein
MTRFTARDSYYYAGIASWGRKYAIGVVDGGANTKLAGTGAAADIKPEETHALRFAVQGSKLTLYDDGREVLSVVDPTLVPAVSFVGLQSSTATGKTSFENVSVHAL